MFVRSLRLSPRLCVSAGNGIPSDARCLSEWRRWHCPHRALWSANLHDVASVLFPAETRRGRGKRRENHESECSCVLCVCLRVSASPRGMASPRTRAARRNGGGGIVRTERCGAPTYTMSQAFFSPQRRRDAEESAEKTMNQNVLAFSAFVSASLRLRGEWHPLGRALPVGMAT